MQIPHQMDAALRKAWRDAVFTVGWWILRAPLAGRRQQRSGEIRQAVVIPVPAEKAKRGRGKLIQSQT
jgi:hypothetical protein